MQFSHYTVVCLFGFNVIAKHCPLLNIEQFKIIHSIIIIVGPNQIFLIAVDSPILISQFNWPVHVTTEVHVNESIFDNRTV